MGEKSQLQMFQEDMTNAILGQILYWLEKENQEEEREKKVLRLFFAAFTLSLVLYLNSRFQIALSALDERRE